MKITLSPSKTQKDEFKFNKFSDFSNEIINKEATLKLFNNIKNMSMDSMAKIFKIKGSLLEETYKLYQSFSEENKMINAIHCYDGVVFNEIKIYEYNKSKLDYMNKHFVILTAMYGLVEPQTKIWNYRLDMTIKPDGINLYNYWKETIDTYFKNEDVIINLASDEFSKMLKSFQKNIINIHFKERNKDGKFKIVSFNAKKARGIMSNYIIYNEVNDLSEIKNFNLEGYKFEGQISDDRNYYFIR